MNYVGRIQIELLTFKTDDGKFVTYSTVAPVNGKVRSDAKGSGETLVSSVLDCMKDLQEKETAFLHDCSTE